MSTKIVCKGCGQRNDLGRVFCGGCGKRLDLSSTSLAELGDHSASGVSGLVRKCCVALLLLAVVGTAGLILWPQPARDKPGLPSGARSVPLKLEGLKIAVEGQRSAAATFAEAEINGYLAAWGRDHKLSSLTVDLQPGQFDALAVWPLAPALLGRGRVRLQLSLFLCGSFQGRGLAVRSARLGHLPLPGVCAALAVKWFSGLAVAAVGQPEVARAVREVRLEAHSVVVKVGG